MEATPAHSPDNSIPILLIEDNTGMSDLLKALLRMKGCYCHVERSGHSALDITKRIEPRLIICDIQLLSQVNGLDVARAIRSDPEVAHTPLIALSANSSEPDRQRALEAGFDCFFPKPFPYAEFTDTIDRYISGNVA